MRGQVVCVNKSFLTSCCVVVCVGGGGRSEDGSGGRKRRTEAEGSAQPKTRTSHKDVGKNEKYVLDCSG